MVSEMSDMFEDVWEPSKHPDFNSLMPEITEKELNRLLAASTEERIAFLMDPRAVHRAIFQRFVDGGRTEFAGHYRGEDIPGLGDCRVGLDYSDNEETLHIVFSFPEEVDEKIKQSHQVLIRKFSDKASASNNPASIVPSIVSILFNFLSLHPFANGNGHIARIMFPVLVSLTQCKIKPGWNINPSSFTDEFKRNLMKSMAPGSTTTTRQPHLVALNSFFSAWIC